MSSPSSVWSPARAARAYSPALTDFVFMVRDTATMFVTGPDVVSAVTGERVTAMELGGTGVHGTHGGVASFVVDDVPGRASSADLARWQLHWPALSPHPEALDHNGCWSGNTVAVGNDLDPYCHRRRPDPPLEPHLEPA